MANLPRLQAWVSEFDSQDMGEPRIIARSQATGTCDRQRKEQGDGSGKTDVLCITLSLFSFCYSRSTALAH